MAERDSNGFLWFLQGSVWEPWWACCTRRNRAMKCATSFAPGRRKAASERGTKRGECGNRPVSGWIAEAMW